MKIILFLLVFTSALLGTWQVYRFFYKCEVISKIENCTISDTSNIGNSLHCNIIQEAEITQKNLFFLFKDIESFYILVPVNINGENFLVNLGYIKKDDEEKVKAILKGEQFLSFAAIIINPKSHSWLLLRNDFTQNHLYDLNIKEINKKTNLNLSKYVLLSYENNFVNQNEHIIIKNKKPYINQFMHIGYALMWYCIFIAGVFYLYFLLVSINKK